MSKNGIFAHFKSKQSRQLQVLERAARVTLSVEILLNNATE